MLELQIVDCRNSKDDKNSDLKIEFVPDNVIKYISSDFVLKEPK